MSASTYHARRAMGKCVNCGIKVDDGRSLCLACRMERRERRRANWPSISERECAKLRAQMKDRRREAKDAGLCYTCFKRPVKPGRANCPYCLARKNYLKKLKRDGHRISDMPDVCPRCGKPSAQGYKLCAGHLDSIRKAAAIGRAVPRKKNLFELYNSAAFVR